ncbi:MAG: NUDIX domain-containing protein [Nitrosarchaeum sp.]|nr:NUDIX domain-containing protein [Nitrosarchaeum sp.]
MDIRKRRRGTAIVETSKGILVTSGRSKIFILPGGGANKGETRTVAAIRELKEETGLTANYVKVLFRYAGRVHKSHSGGFFQDHHTVCLIKADGIPKPKHEIKHIAYYHPDSDIKISKTTQEIIDKFQEYKKENPNYNE